jgi:hypothetical protein
MDRSHLDTDVTSRSIGRAVDPFGPGKEQRFVIRFFVEPEEEGHERRRWHGYVDDITSRTPYPFRDIRSLSDFLIAQLDRLGVTPGLSYRLRRQLGLIRLISPSRPTTPTDATLSDSTEGDRP